MSTLPTLPDLCLLVIFDKLPIIDFLSIDRVCHRWAVLQPVAALRRRSLTLLVSSEAQHHLQQPLSPVAEQFRFQGSLNQAEHHQQNVKLSVSQLNDAIVERLVTKLPHLDTLVIILDTVPPKQVTPVLDLLTAYQNTLTTVRFYSYLAMPFAKHFRQMNPIDVPKQLAALFDALARLPKLTTLTFENSNTIAAPSTTTATDVVPLELPFLGQLKTLEFATGHQANLLYPSLFTLAEPSDTLAAISLGNTMEYRALNQFLRSPNIPESAKKYEHLSVRLHDSIANQEAAVWEHFTELFSAHLSSLEVQLSSSRLPAILQSLATFDVLTRLHLKLDFPKVFRWTVDRSSESALADIALTAVHTLTLTATTFAHSQLTNLLDIPRTFPNLTALTIIITNRDCFTCGYGQMRDNQEPSDEEVLACLKAQVVGLKGQCTKLVNLKTIHQRVNIVKRWSLEEL